jgi:hypothetical protein
MQAPAGAAKHSDAAVQEPTPHGLLQRICKLRWMGMEQEAARMQAEMHGRLPGGGVLTTQSETD